MLCQGQRSLMTLGITVTLIAGSVSVFAQAPARTFPRTDEGAASQSGEAQRTKTAEEERIGKAISERLQSDRIVPSYQVVTTMSNGVVILDGKVETLLAQERVLAVAKAVPGVRDVQNQVKLSVPGRDDWEVLSDVKTVLRTNALLADDALQSEVDDGVITLSGSVGSEHRKYLAETLVKSVPGVILVENEIRAAPVAGRPDLEIRRDVQSSIQWDPVLNSPDVSVGVEQGSVALAGVVESAEAKERLEKVALVTGARSVDVSQVRVAPATGTGGGPLQPGGLTPTGRPSGRASERGQ